MNPGGGRPPFRDHHYGRSLDCGHMTSDPRNQVLVASNRGPVSFAFAADGSLSGRRGGGGMVSGLTSGLAARAVDGPSGGPAVWVCAAMSQADRVAAGQG